jgi:hypothetical protein
MRLTNAQRGTLIDALSDAIELARSSIEAVTVNGKVPDPEDREDVREWRASLHRYRVLRRAYLAEEKTSLRDFFSKPSKRSVKPICHTRKGGAS